MSLYRNKVGSLADRKSLQNDMSVGNIPTSQTLTPQPEIDWLARSDMMGRSETPQEDVKKLETKPSTDKTSAALDAAKSSQEAIGKGGAVDGIASGLTTYGAATANPKMVAAGLALQTMSGIQKQKQKQQMDNYTAEIERIRARQAATDKLSQIGQGLRV